MAVLRRHGDPQLDERWTDDDVADRRVPDRTEIVEQPVEPRLATERDVAVERWSLSDVLIALVGAAMTVVGAIALVRTGVDRSWYRPVTEVLEANHTPLLGAIEVGAGVLLMLAGAFRSRALAALIGLAMVVGGILGAVETSEVSRELAIEDWWAWLAVGVGAFVTLIALVSPKRTVVERVAETR